MVEFFNNGGIIQWLLLLIAVLIIVQATAVPIFRKKWNVDKILKKANSVLFWGCLSLLISCLYSLLSFYRFGASLMNVKKISAEITLTGLAYSLVPIISSIFILLFSLSFWYVISKAYKK